MKSQANKGLHIYVLQYDNFVLFSVIYIEISYRILRAQRFFRDTWAWFSVIIYSQWLVDHKSCENNRKILCHCQDIANLLLGILIWATLHRCCSDDCTMIAKESVCTVASHNWLKYSELSRTVCCKNNSRPVVSLCDRTNVDHYACRRGHSVRPRCKQTNVWRDAFSQP